MLSMGIKPVNESYVINCALDYLLCNLITFNHSTCELDFDPQGLALFMNGSDL